MPLSNKIKSLKQNLDPKPTGVVWVGPQDNGPKGGISFSLLSRWLVDRERFRLHAIEGLQVNEALDMPIQFGNLWHACEEGFASQQKWDLGLASAKTKLDKQALKLAKKFPNDATTIKHWVNVIDTTFRAYQHHWSEHPDVLDRKPLGQEQTFCVRIELPDGRFVYLRGKWDAVDLIKIGKAKHAVYIQENKSKIRIDHVLLRRQLKFDCQTMIYLVAARECQRQTASGSLPEGVSVWKHGTEKVHGVRYNVVKRSQHKQTRETEEGFSNRLAAIIAEDPADWFARYNVEISDADVTRFMTEFLEPTLMNLCDWYAHVKFAKENNTSLFGKLHWRHPFGVYNVLNEGGASDLDDYIDTGSRAGLRRVTNMFPELTEEADDT